MNTEADLLLGFAINKGVSVWVHCVEQTQRQREIDLTYNIMHDEINRPQLP